VRARLLSASASLGTREEGLGAGYEGMVNPSSSGKKANGARSIAKEMASRAV